VSEIQVVEKIRVSDVIAVAGLPDLEVLEFEYQHGPRKGEKIEMVSDYAVAEYLQRKEDKTMLFALWAVVAIIILLLVALHLHSNVAMAAELTPWPTLPPPVKADAYQFWLPMLLQGVGMAYVSNKRSSKLARRQQRMWLLNKALYAIVMLVAAALFWTMVVAYLSSMPIRYY
jgi:hypothetical protein